MQIVRRSSRRLLDQVASGARTGNQKRNIFIITVNISGLGALFCSVTTLIHPDQFIVTDYVEVSGLGGGSDD